MFKIGRFAAAISAAGNTPGARQGAASWTDKNGNLWLFGGDGYDAASTYSNLNDLWELNPGPILSGGVL